MLLDVNFPSSTTIARYTMTFTVYKEIYVGQQSPIATPCYTFANLDNKLKFKAFPGEFVIHEYQHGLDNVPFE